MLYEIFCLTVGVPAMIGGAIFSSARSKLNDVAISASVKKNREDYNAWVKEVEDRRALNQFACKTDITYEEIMDACGWRNRQMLKKIGATGIIQLATDAKLPIMMCSSGYCPRFDPYSLSDEEYKGYIRFVKYWNSVLMSNGFKYEMIMREDGVDYWISDYVPKPGWYNSGGIIGWEPLFRYKNNGNYEIKHRLRKEIGDSR